MTVQVSIATFQLSDYFAGKKAVFRANKALADFVPTHLPTKDAYDAAATCLVGSYEKAEEHLRELLIDLCDTCTSESIKSWADLEQVLWNALFRVHSEVRMQEVPLE